MNRPDAADALGVLGKALGGLDIAGLCRGVPRGRPVPYVPVLVDGFIIRAWRRWCAARLCPACADHMLGSHASEEPASRLVLSESGLRPCLYAGMRTGRGHSGPWPLMPLPDMGLAVYLGDGHL